MGQFAINSTDDVKIKQFVKITPTNISYFDILHLAKKIQNLRKNQKNKFWDLKKILLKSKKKKIGFFSVFFFLSKSFFSKIEHLLF